MKNWKTTLAGAFLVIASLAKVFGYISGEELTGIIGILAAYGFLFTKDYNVTGTSDKVDKPETRADDFIGNRPDERK